MTSHPTAATPVNDGVLSRSWGGGWRRFVFPGVWLIYLGETVAGVHDFSSGLLAVVGYLVVAAFAVAYILALPFSWTNLPRAFWWLYAAGVALTVAETFLARDTALVFLVYVAVLTMASRARWAPAAILLYTAVAAFVPPLVPFWHQGIEWSTGLAVVLVSFAMWGFFHIIEANQQLADARAEVARLAAENERTRIARDLHDLLGHSLTTITVKAGLARRLGERGDSDRAAAEIAEVEQLSRRTLGDVRAAVSAHREVTLAGELATAREVLRAAGIVAELPASVADTDPAYSELFGWTVREGITNVVRHSRASHVRIVVARSSVEIVDDGLGASGACTGNGLRGLRERTQGAGGELTTASTGSGFRLRVQMPRTPTSERGTPPAPAAASTPAESTPAASTPAASPPGRPASAPTS